MGGDRKPSGRKWDGKKLLTEREREPQKEKQLEKEERKIIHNCPLGTRCGAHSHSLMKKTERNLQFLSLSRKEEKR